MASTQALPRKPRASISAFIICCNEERNIRRCLESVSWCDEIVLIDSGSEDATLAIAREYTDRIYSRAWPGFVEQKRYALSLCLSEWVLNIDADEVVSPQLREEILQLLEQDAEGATRTNGYELSRVVFHLGKWWRKGGWYPEYRLRLCRRTATTWGGDDPHEKALVDGPIRKLRGELLHYTYVDLSAQVAALNRFSSSAAQTMLKKGQASSLFSIFIRPLSRFFKFYILKKGFLEGFPGFVVALLEAYYVFLKYVKLWECQHQAEREALKE